MGTNFDCAKAIDVKAYFAVAGAFSGCVSLTSKKFG